MPSIQYNLVNSIKKMLYINDNIIFENFVETGTYLGQTIFNMEPYFKNLYTIEIKKEFFENVKNIYNGNKINFILGDSSKEIINLCKILNGNTIFFLDGHWSAGDTGRANKDCPLYEELLGIMDNFLYESIIIIDDVRLFGKGPNLGNEICDWEQINEKNILNIVEYRLIQYFYYDSEICVNDRLILHIKKV